MTSGWARFWAVDLHVHTPGSSDARDEDFGTATAIVQQALKAGLDAIAVTDHNTAAWCGQMAAAAKGTKLVVLPGFELSTSDGHLLGIWEEGTAPSTIEDVLIRVGIERSRFGDLNVVSTKNMAECAFEIRDRGGLAIAAHIDKERGILTQPVKTHVNQLLADQNIAAFEFVLAETPAKVAAKLGQIRYPALIQSSDAYDAALSRHAATGIGIRRSWIKAARPDLCGLRYALQDPELRVTLIDPATAAPHPTIDSVSISGGFLAGTTLYFSPDLNCLLGGTGVGKSLVLEALRFSLNQQVDGVLFNTIRDEVDRRLETALVEGTTVAVTVSTPTEQYRVSRTLSASGSAPVVEQDVSDEWVRVDEDPADLLSVAAFSQGEILEYARQPVGRVGLIDAKIDLTQIEGRIAESQSKLRANGTALVSARDEVQTLTEQAAEGKNLKERERELAALFDDELVKSQGRWAAEQRALRTLAESVDGITFVRPSEPDSARAKMTPEHDAEFERIRVAQTAFKSSVDTAEKLVADSLGNLKAVVGEVKDELDTQFNAFKKQLDETLEKSGSTSLPRLRRELETAQTNLSQADAAARTLKNEAEPAYKRLSDEREALLGELKRARDDRRALRRQRTADLNRKTSGFVKVDIPAKGDTAAFRRALDTLKVGTCP